MTVGGKEREKEETVKSCRIQRQSAVYPMHLTGVDFFIFNQFLEVEKILIEISGKAIVTVSASLAFWGLSTSHSRPVNNFLKK